MKVRVDEFIALLNKSAMHAERAIKFVSDAGHYNVIGTGKFSQYKGVLNVEGTTEDFAISKEAISKISDVAYFAKEHLVLELQDGKLTVLGDCGNVKRVISTISEEIPEVNLTSGEAVEVSLPKNLLAAVSHNATFVSNLGNKSVAIGFTTEGEKTFVKLTALCGSGFVAYSRTTRLSHVTDSILSAAEKNYCVAISNQALNTAVFDTADDHPLTIKIANNMVVISDGKSEVTGITISNFGNEPGPTRIYPMLAGFPANDNHCQVSATDLAKALNFVEGKDKEIPIARIDLKSDGLYVSDKNNENNVVKLSCASITGEFCKYVRKDHFLAAITNLANADKQIVIGVGTEDRFEKTVLVYSSKAAYAICMPINER